MSYSLNVFATVVLSKVQNIAAGRKSASGTFASAAFRADLADACNLADEVDKRYRNSLCLNLNYLPLLRSWITLVPKPATHENVQPSTLTFSLFPYSSWYVMVPVTILTFRRTARFLPSVEVIELISTVGQVISSAVRPSSVSFHFFVCSS